MKKSCLSCVLGSCLLLLPLYSNIAHAVSVSGQGTWETTLQARDFDGDINTIEGYYDTALDITWLADANYSGNWMDWTTANSWAAGLDINGITGWRLPDISPVDGTTFNDTSSKVGSADVGFNISAPGTIYAGSNASELAHMYYNTLGNLGYWDTSGNGPQDGWGLSNTGPFSNVTANLYWSSTPVPPSIARYFSFYQGSQGAFESNNSLLAWAVHSGDVGAAVVPVPAAVWLFGSGLLGLVSISRHKKAA